MAHAATNHFENGADIAGRILLSAMFLMSGLGKISGFAATQGYMEASGVPGALLPLVIALEGIGALAIIVGYRSRIAAGLLAAFTIAAGVLFHGGDDQVQQIMFLKNIAIAGGFLLLVARGAGDWSLDARNRRLTAPGELLRTRT